MAFFDIITLVEAVLMVFSIYLKLISNGVKSVCSDVQFFSGCMKNGPILYHLGQKKCLISVNSCIDVVK